MHSEDFAELENGEVVNVWSYGVPNDNAVDFKGVDFSSSLRDYKHYMHATHGMIYSLSTDILWNRYPRFGNVLMQIRNDGNLGFGGGLCDAKEDVVTCLNRELQEEFCLDENMCKFEDKDHIMTVVNDKKKMVNHFYAKEVSAENFESIEKNIINAKDWATETMGMTRVPLFIMEDELRGLPTFLTNHFAGCAKEQLLETLKQRKIISEEHLKKALDGYKRIVSCRQL